MTKPDGIPMDASTTSPWGTWEDLLLAFAVNRHGPNAWDSIASELDKRISVSPTPLICRNKYLDLRRRFLHDDSKSDTQISSLLLDELRKLRVAELRREVQRYDLNIESLELKMKKMEEERERSLERENNAADLNKDKEKTEATPATTGEQGAGEEFDKDQLSVNESNSTDPDAEKLGKGQKESEPDRRAVDEAEHDRTGGTSEEPSGLKVEPDQKSAREDSCNGSSNSIEKSERKAKAEANSSGQGGGGIVDSEADSGGGGEAATKENSDVQSSASRSRKEEGSDKLRRGNTGGDAREHEDQSLAVKQLSTESQPLVGFLQAIKAHKFGSVFQRRLRSQESSKYQKVILQHMDIGIIEARVKEGFYTGSTIKFFRDLLLLVNNAHVFFGKNSAEANAATEMRWVISKEISQKQAKSDSSSGKHVSLQSLSLTKKEEPELSRSLMLKPLIVCRKRSSIAAKASSTSSAKKKEMPDEKDVIPQQSQSNTEEVKITKKRSRDSFPSVPTTTKKTGKNQYSAKNAAASESGKPQPGKGGTASTSTLPPQQTENKKDPTSSESKKRGAANFLNRMKQGGGGSSNNGVLLDALKNTPLTSESSSGKGGGGSEQKKTESKKKEAVSKKSKEKSSAAKRNVGRPPKRGAAPPAATGKRNREEDETEAPPTKQPKKRSRKL